MTSKTDAPASLDAPPLTSENVSDEESDNNAEASPSAVVGQPQQPLSKNAQKRLAKEARRAEQKLVWRAREKEKRKQKKAEKRKLQAEASAAGEDADDGQPPAKRARVEHPKRIPFNARVVIDLAFDDKMTVKEVNSLCSQLNHTHSANKKTARPIADLLMTGLSGRTKERLDGMNDKAYLRWKGVDWWEEGYERLWEGVPRNDAGEPGGANGSAAGDTDQDVKEQVAPAGPSEPPEKGRQPKEHTAAKESVIYLTADSEYEVSELKEGETYIIGGIVDRNRYKNLCQTKAAAQGVRTGRLPIGTYLANMPTRKVLTVNQVFEILVKWTEERDWEKALTHVMPKRKFKDPNANNTQGKKIEDELDNDDEGDNDEDGEGELEEEESDLQRADGAVTPQDTQVFEDEVPKRE
ncbi:tRNA (guanine(9)-N(1))-methyltransferase [Tulasnella sp. 424]|nr:tRNA (guanine(9)-N(1))-methyltransferase [Tulasnella sp. 424]KAG8970595.1 tRNA (guanine(9)-N(1))-methyltransferase [Tulasnella sp. 425]